MTQLILTDADIDVWEVQFNILTYAWAEYLETDCGLFMDEI